jgi:hypothetical protein
VRDELDLTISDNLMAPSVPIFFPVLSEKSNEATSMYTPEID